MALKFQHSGFEWTLREGFPSIGATISDSVPIIEALKVAHPPLSTWTTHQIASWIVARLSYLTSGSLEREGNDFAHDTNEIGYKLRISGQNHTMLAHGAVVIQMSRIYFACLNIGIDDFQSLVIKLLADSPNDLSIVQVRVRDPGNQKIRRYGWDGFSLLT
jgi:hypothetical protein